MASGGEVLELRALAEQILFGTTLEEKLRCPETITDHHPGSPILAPGAPGRPAELQFKLSGTGRAEFPGLQRLDQERERGRLLHFFANHELLATELMALVLLRFPDAPPAFRRGVLRTLQDEQAHTRAYLRRMAECGVEFGELAVSGYFWRAVSGMQDPIDYVAGLSLTFEQANLDFCRHFAAGFAQAGDAATAGLLERIYRDEIAHVAYGLKWFRRWKNPGQSDWEAFCRHLRFPLSPQRAKGIFLNVEGRRAAGLETDFIAQLNVFSQSKGRTPGVFVFNPFTEAYIARGFSFTPTKHQRSLAEDLASLPQFLGRQDDIVLVPRRPSVEFLSGLKQAGFPLPEFVELKAGSIAPDDPICSRKLGMLRPWAWGPESARLLAPLLINLTGKVRGMTDLFNEKIARLYSKAFGAGLLKKVVGDPWLCGEAEIGVEVHTADQAFEAIAAVRRRGHHKVVLKEAFGLAGHNAIRLWEPDLLESQRRWITRALENGQSLIVEPWLERVADFSVQLEMDRDGLRIRGFTGLVNDLKGQFVANSAAPDYRRRVPAEVLAMLRRSENMSARLLALYERISELLQEELCRAGYQGAVGIDAFVYRTAEGEYRLKPIVEINPRYTMGRVMVELMSRVCQGSHGVLRLLNRSTARAEGFADFQAQARALVERHPLRLEGEPVHRIREGAVFLNDPACARVCLAVLQVLAPAR